MAALKRYCHDAPEVIQSRRANAKTELEARRWSEAGDLLNCRSDYALRPGLAHAGLSIIGRQERVKELDAVAENPSMCTLDHQSMRPSKSLV